MTFESRHWAYTPGFIPSKVFDYLLPEARKFCTRGQGSRLSCVFSKSRAIYNCPRYPWKASLIVKTIKGLVEQKTRATYDYCLLHIYENGGACINWHNDSEALESNIASVSLGTPRKFRIRRIGQKRGWEEEFLLGSGDLFFMKGPCDHTKGFQKIYQHCVPKELKIKTPRVSLTFRQF